MCLGKNATSQDESDVKTLMGAVGKIFTCPETQLSAVTGLSGSGPAYIFVMIEVRSSVGTLPASMVQLFGPQQNNSSQA